MGELAYSFHLSSKGHAVGTIGKVGQVSKHNLRAYKSDDYDPGMISVLAGSETSILDSVKKIYEDEFSDALQEYNGKRREDRQIKDYLTHVSQSRNDVAAEIIIQIGERDPNAPQYLVLAFPRDSVNANALLYDVARFNFSSFVVKDFDLEPMSFGEIGLLVIKGFANLRELEYYRSVMAQDNFDLPEGVRPIMISKHNFELLLNEGRSFEEYFRFEADPPAPADLPEPVPPDSEEIQEEDEGIEAEPAAEPQPESEEASKEEPEAEPENRNL